MDFMPKSQGNMFQIIEDLASYIVCTGIPFGLLLVIILYTAGIEKFSG
jgi:hypothetical protein